jgi:hypothetical protein
MKKVPTSRIIELKEKCSSHSFNSDDYKDLVSLLLEYIEEIENEQDESRVQAERVEEN